MRNSEADCHSLLRSSEQVHGGGGDDGDVGVGGTRRHAVHLRLFPRQSARELHCIHVLMAGVTHVGKVCGRVKEAYILLQGGHSELFQEMQLIYSL